MHVERKFIGLIKTIRASRLGCWIPHRSENREQGRNVGDDLWYDWDDERGQTYGCKCIRRRDDARVQSDAHRLRRAADRHFLERRVTGNVTHLWGMSALIQER